MKSGIDRLPLNPYHKVCRPLPAPYRFDQLMNLKRWLLGASVALASVLAPSAAWGAGGDSDARSYKGEKTLALRGGYIGYNESATAGLEFTYRFSRLFRLAPSLDYVFRHHDTDALIIDLDAQFLFPFSGDRMAFFPYAGPKYASWTLHPGGSRESNDVSSRRSRLGIDAGVGIEANITPVFRIGISGGYTFIKYFHGFDAALTLSYRF